MNVSTLIHNHKTACPNSHFFDNNTLKFFGERKSEMRVLKKKESIEDRHGKVHECYVLSTYQRNAPFSPRRNYFFFDSETYEEIIV